jgi:ribosomal protein S18 acetylase RimI-like enzyme
MTPAMALYESFGFQRIPAYYDNPSGFAVFMVLKLR